MARKRDSFLMALPVALALLGSTGWSATRTWIPSSGTNDWFVDANWSGNVMPTNGDDVVITNANIGVLLTNSTPALSSFVISNRATLIFSNWDTTLSATNVQILSNAVVTCSGPYTNSVMSNRVWIACSNILVASGGRINVSNKGYGRGDAKGKDGNGPGGGGGYQPGAGGGGGHGGFGGGGFYTYVVGDTRGGLPYDSATAPVMPGSAAGNGNGLGGGAGGGAVRINAPDGMVTVNGAISADGELGVDTGGGGGSGGSIWIACRTIAGTNGIVSANGGRAYNSGCCNGGGGRIAVLYDTNAQAEIAVPNVVFSVLPGMRAGGIAGDLGTLYFPDSRLLTDGTQPRHNGQWMAPDLNAWTLPELTLSNVWLRFGAEGFRLTVSNQLLIVGSTGRLDVGGNAVITNRNAGGNRRYYNYFLCSDFTNAPQLACYGNLIVTNGSTLGLFAAGTNGGTTNYGALVTVNNSLFVGASSTVYVSSNPTNGGSVLFRVRDLILDATNSLMDANCNGYAGGSSASRSAGYGPGGGGQKSGGSYGGRGGSPVGGSPAPYGSSNAPTLPGSGGGWGNSYDSPGGTGGGLVWVDARSRVTVNGIISANGMDIAQWAYYAGAGSGGGIYITCRRFVGGANGILRANGGIDDSTQIGGIGAGGRIAVWFSITNIASGFTAQANAGVAVGGDYAAENGTVVWGQIPPSGTMVMIR